MPITELQCAQALRAAGCPPGVAARMVATARRESSLVPTVHSYGLPGSGCGPGDCGRPYTVNGISAVCEDSYGLWAINLCPSSRRGPRFTPAALLTPIGNALAASAISAGFTDLSPWGGGAEPSSADSAAVQQAYGGSSGSGRTLPPGCTEEGVGQIIAFMQQTSPAGLDTPKDKARVIAATRKRFGGSPVAACITTAIADFYGGDPGNVAPETIPGLVGSAPGDIISNILRGPASAIEKIAQLIGFLLDPHNWLRIGAALLGVVLFVAGLWFVAKDWQRG